MFIEHPLDALAVQPAALRRGRRARRLDRLDRLRSEPVGYLAVAVLTGLLGNALLG
jgi:hypothetical protein